MIRIKDDSVCIANISPGMLLGLIVADQVYTQFGYDCIVTSANDAHHSDTSLHYDNDALDLRTKHVPTSQRLQIRNEIKRRLGLDYDVVLEANPDHMHLEKQPRRR